MRALAVVVVAAACTHTYGPTAVLHFEGTWTAADREAARRGASVWAQIDFRYALDASPLPACPRDWYQRKVTACAIHVGLRWQPGLQADYSASGMTDRGTREILLDPQWHGWALTSIVAHELGHVLLDTARHLAAGLRGVMQAHTSTWEPSAADRALACETIGRGC